MERKHKYQYELDETQEGRIEPATEAKLATDLRHTDFPPSDPRLSRRVQRLKPSGIRRFFDMASEMGDTIISLSIGEPDFTTPAGICEQAINSIKQGMTHYTSNKGLTELRSAVADYLCRRFQVSYDVESEILMTVGGSEALDLAMRSLLNPGDEVIIPQPAFVSYQACAELAGAKVCALATSPHNNFKMTAKQLEEHISDKTKLLVIASPNNPTGTVYSRKELTEIAAVCERHNLFIVSDELYVELTYNGEFTSFASIPGMKERTVLVGGFSKAFAMTGWRIGYLCSDAGLVDGMTRIHQYAIMSSPTIAQLAAVEALNGAEKYIKPMRREFLRRRNFIAAFLNEHQIPCVAPEGAFYVFPDIRATGMSSIEFCERLLNERQVAIVPGCAFGDCGAGFVRISYASDMQKIKVGLERFKSFYYQNLC